MTQPRNELLLICTGNYYRSRFAEFYFRHIAAQQNLAWDADSRGLRLSASNVRPLSVYTSEECERNGVSTDPMRHPIALEQNDLESASLTIAVKETELRPLMRQIYPAGENRIEYWEVHDIDCATPEESLPILRRLVDELVERLAKMHAGQSHG